MTTLDVLAAADRNMVGAWRTMLGVAPAPAETGIGNGVLLSSGLPVPLFNPAIVTGPVADPAGVVRGVTDHYAQLGAPFVLWFREEVTEGMADACASAGLVEHWQPPLMVLEPVPRSAPAAPDELVIDEITPAVMDEYAHVLGEGFGMPRELVDAIASPRLAELAGFTFVIGRVDGVPLATAAVFTADDTAGIYNVATVPDGRGRGYGAAVTWAAIDRGRDSGAERVILQSSEQGAPVYERMGFTAPTRYRQYQAA